MNSRELRLRRVASSHSHSILPHWDSPSSPRTPSALRDSSLWDDVPSLVVRVCWVCLAASPSSNLQRSSRAPQHSSSSSTMRDLNLSQSHQMAAISASWALRATQNCCWCDSPTVPAAHAAAAYVHDRDRATSSWSWSTRWAMRTQSRAGDSRTVRGARMMRSPRWSSICHSLRNFRACPSRALATFYHGF